MVRFLSKVKKRIYIGIRGLSRYRANRGRQAVFRANPSCSIIDAWFADLIGVSYESFFQLCCRALRDTGSTCRTNGKRH